MMMSGTRRESVSLVWEHPWVIFWYSGHRKSVNAGGLPGERHWQHWMGHCMCHLGTDATGALKTEDTAHQVGLALPAEARLVPWEPPKKIKKQEGWFPPQTCAWSRNAVWSSIYLHCIECSSSRFIYLQAHKASTASPYSAHHYDPGTISVMPWSCPASRV